MEHNYLAHVRKNEDDSWACPHLLSDHTSGVAELAEEFGAAFQSGTWGKAAGLGHDAGKGRQIWQKYLCAKSGYDEEAHLENKRGKIPHAIHGALLAEQIFGRARGRILSYCLAGHHAGLPDWSSSLGAGKAALSFQMQQVKDLGDLYPGVIDALKAVELSPPPWKFARGGMDLALWIRMLYSCLVDADFLDTESYMNPQQFQSRGNYCSMAELHQRFNAFMGDLVGKSKDTTVNTIRREIQDRCIQMAQGSQGIYSLSVPTGGGKTLSSLAFALEHAQKHQLKRIIYVIPYTSIVEQNADVIRNAVGYDQVIEHHVNLDEDKITVKSRLAAENWDAPVVITTSVQFFESLFAAKSSRCRKLHNIVGSVVVLDEAQLVPVEFLAPILESMQLLVDHYQVTFVISTATQPAFKKRVLGDGRVFNGFQDIKEIIGNKEAVEGLYQSLVRCKIEFPQDINAVSQWEEIASALKNHAQTLCVVSDRQSCRELHALMPEGTYHLSALMCGQHRSDIIHEIKRKLKDGGTVRVISTQLVEAGVDLDFPIVYRAMAGLDSIAQAAGRCNREGGLPVLGRVVVFNQPRAIPAGLLKKAMEITQSLAVGMQGDSIAHDMFEKFFTELYWRAKSLDEQGIVSLLDPDHNDLSECSIYFRTAAAKFKIIDDALQKTIFVRYGEGDELIDSLKDKGPERRLMRRLQRYAVNVYNFQFDDLLHKGSVEEVFPGIFALSTGLDYDKTIGLLLGDIDYDPGQLII